MTTRDKSREAHYVGGTVTTLPIEEIIEMRPTHLYCSMNYLTELPDNLPDSIKTIDCSTNHITHLPETLPPGVTDIRCCENNISTLPKNLPIGIKTLIMMRCPLKTLPVDICKYKSLNVLCLRTTLVTELPDLPESLCTLRLNKTDQLYKVINETYFDTKTTNNGYYIGITFNLNNRDILRINAINSQRRTQARTRIIAPGIMEHYARRTMHPDNLAPLLDDPDADISEFMDAYVAGL